KLTTRESGQHVSRGSNTSGRVLLQCAIHYAAQLKRHAWHQPMYWHMRIAQYVIRVGSVAERVLAGQQPVECATCSPNVTLNRARSPSVPFGSSMRKVLLTR